MASIKPIEGYSVHQIQSGQVIINIFSAVKELVENSLDSGATSLDVRFKNYGLESIEVQDNGSGMAPEDFDTVALKHYTSKIARYEDIDVVRTFGFRGEALSSLSALCNLHISTARAIDAPKGTRLDFDRSGKVKEKSTIACQSGTTVIVADIFQTLPVRRRELEKNIRREYGRAIGILQAYASIGVGVKYTVTNQPSKSKRTTVFSTNGNATTRDNIANVYGAKTLSALIPLDLKFDMQPKRSVFTLKGQKAGSSDGREIKLVGHVSRPVVGGGRATPDRQMFFVNSRPCNLPQVARAVNEVYKSFNVTQSPFIFLNLLLDTTSYDVNVSPDKMTILLHDESGLIEPLKSCLTDLYELQSQSVPLSQVTTQRRLVTQRSDSSDVVDFLPFEGSRNQQKPSESSIITSPSSETQSDGKDSHKTQVDSAASLPAEKISTEFVNARQFMERSTDSSGLDRTSIPSIDSSRRRESQIDALTFTRKQHKPSEIQNAFNYMRARRVSKSSPTISVGNRYKSSSSHDRFSKRRRTDSYDDSEAESPTSTTDTESKRGKVSAALSQVESDGESEDASGLESSQLSIPEAESRPRLVTNVDENFRGSKLGDDLAEPVEETVKGKSATDDAAKRSGDRAAEKLIAVAKAGSANINLKRSSRARVRPNLKGKETVVNLKQTFRTDVEDLTKEVEKFHHDAQHANSRRRSAAEAVDDKDASSESLIEKTAITIAKSDFAMMRIVGQFNLGFILVVRPSGVVSRSSCDAALGSELFIVDQHASDEKHNFERLQQTTVMNSQPLVCARQLELTAMEEEVVINHLPTLRQNGFAVTVDDMSSLPVGRRCTLTALPTSREVVFNLQDLEELIAMLSESSSGVGQAVLRPSKVVKLFAMRACRSSIMIGKPLSHERMGKVISNLGRMDKPWNCPHGRPTMRHLYQLDKWNTWVEGDGVAGITKAPTRKTNWSASWGL